jgi:hypothetical protein
MDKPITIADKAIALAVLEALIKAWETADDAPVISEFILDAASRVRFQPSTRQLILTFDLASEG